MVAGINLPQYLRLCGHTCGKRSLKNCRKLLASRHVPLLATAVVQVKDASGRWQLCRALLDSVSQTNFVSIELIKRLGVKTFKKYIPAGGIAQALTELNKPTTLYISSRVTRYHKSLEFLVLDKITSELPTTRINNGTWNIQKMLSLADPDLNVPTW